MDRYDDNREAVLRELHDARRDFVLDLALAYKADGDHFRDITRQVLFGAETGGASELRYFEIGPDGHSTLERHEHTHSACGRWQPLLPRQLGSGAA